MAIVDPRIKALQDKVDLLDKQLRQLTTLTYRSEVAGGVVNYAYADLPLPSISGKMAFCTDCRRSDQGAGAGTGVLVVVALLGGILAWVNVYDPTTAAVT